MRKITYKDKSWMIERFRKILRFIPEQVEGWAFNNNIKKAMKWNQKTGEVIIFENKKEWEEFLNEQEKKKA